MHRIVVANAKGGCGKTTIATNLAAYFAMRQQATVLFDHDPQGSGLAWLKLRNPELPPIHGVAAYRAPATGPGSCACRAMPSGSLSTRRPVSAARN